MGGLVVAESESDLLEVVQALVTTSGLAGAALGWEEHRQSEQNKDQPCEQFGWECEFAACRRHIDVVVTSLVHEMDCSVNRQRWPFPPSRPGKKQTTFPDRSLRGRRRDHGGGGGGPAGHAGAADVWHQSERGDARVVPRPSSGLLTRRRCVELWIGPNYDEFCGR